MDGDALTGRTAQLDTAEREHLENIVDDLRARVEDNVRYQLTQLGLDDDPENADTGEQRSPSTHSHAHGNTQQLVDAIELEAGDGHTWDEAVEQYVTGVGYTVVNRLAALRCMEVRDFVDEEVTVFTANGLTPAAETLVHEEFLLEDEAILDAYRDACDRLADEIEILFDRDSAYSLIEPDGDTFEELCGLLDEVSDDVWLADDVLGWIYEYYNTAQLSAIRKRAHRGNMTIDDVSVANQFYTPHWVVRMLTDNSLGRLYLESHEQLTDAVAAHEALTPEERKTRAGTHADGDSVAELCTYITGGTQRGDVAPRAPEEIRVIDPACGSGHFLLYAFDVLERIWWEQRPDIDRAAVPKKILEQNLYGVDIDLRAAQLAAFNLYLKARGRAEAEGEETFELPSIGIVCADSKITDLDETTAVFDEVARDRPEVREALERLVTEFEDINGLGSLLDVRGTLSEQFLEPGSEKQTTLSADWAADMTLSSFLSTLHDAVEERTGGSFLARDLESFLRLLVILTREYDVALMNPPYGSGKRMPDSVQEYIRDNYRYYPEYYINFFEVCETLTGDAGRIGMIVPRTFMFKRSFEDFRNDFIGGSGAFEYLAEFGNGVLDNATVRTVGTVIRTESEPNATGRFIRLHDVPSGDKEDVFVDVISSADDGGVQRRFEIDHSAFSKIPGNPICYYTHPELKALHESTTKINPEKSGIDADGVADVVQGLATGNNQRFLRAHHEVPADADYIPYAKGGTDAYVLPEIATRVDWHRSGAEVSRYDGSVMRNEEFYGRPGLTWSYIKETGRRFGYFPGGGAFDVTGSMLFPHDESMGWEMLAVLNSDLYHGLFLSLTPERDWQIETVSRIPWVDIFEADDITETVKQQYRLCLAEESYDPASPYFAGPELLPSVADGEFFYETRPSVVALDDPSDIRDDIGDSSESIRALAESAERSRRKRRNEIERLASDINATVFDALDISDEARASVVEEIRLRTKADPTSRPRADGEQRQLRDADLRSNAEGLLHYCLVSAVQENGILPLHAESEKYPGPVDAIETRMERYFGEHASDRLAEIDRIVGSQPPVEETYPNVRAWVESEFFEFHIEQFDQKPIVWKLDTVALTSEAGRGFACFVDYDAVDSSLFDRVQSQLLEVRKATLRKKRNAADRRRGDSSIPATERAEATETYDRCANGLQQIEIFEERIQDIAKETPRDWSPESRRVAEELGAAVERFREGTQDRLRILDTLHDRTDADWFADTFSPTFFETVQENREEWLSALDDLQTACNAYAKPADEPVAAHHYDLFPYFSDLVGSDHYSSNGVLFMTYYFEREGAAFLTEEGEPTDSSHTEEARLLAELATGLDAYKTLAETIERHCDTISSAAQSSWTERALSEVVTNGYTPKRKHGVAINISPLADAEIVPDVVEERVIPWRTV